MSQRKSSKKPLWQIKIADERIHILFEEARKTVSKDIKLANRYVELARKIGMRYNVRISKTLKRKICKNCRAYLMLGVTARQRTNTGKISITCLACNNINRYDFHKNRCKANFVSANRRLTTS